MPVVGQCWPSSSFPGVLSWHHLYPHWRPRPLSGAPFPSGSQSTPSSASQSLLKSLSTPFSPWPLSTGPWLFLQPPGFPQGHLPFSPRVSTQEPCDLPKCQSDQVPLSWYPENSAFACQSPLPWPGFHLTHLPHPCVGSKALAPKLISLLHSLSFRDKDGGRELHTHTASDRRLWSPD